MRSRPYTWRLVFRLLATASALVWALPATGTPIPATAASPAPAGGVPRFRDATDAWDLTFRHDNGASGQRYMVETMGSGVALVDLDSDGWLDAYFAQGAPTPGAGRPRPPRNEAFRGHPDGRFTPVPLRFGAGSVAWSMGVAVADYDNDGFNDLYVTNLGGNELYRNNGDGTFSERAHAAGVADPSWGSSAAWADIDGDGDLDLYVANYVDFTYQNHKFCGDPRRNLRAYCHPDVYDAEADRLYRNEGDGTFSPIGHEAGIDDTVDGKGLGVVFGDYDDDGDPDIYVANDSTRNFLYTNLDGTHFADDGLLAGVGFSSDGQAEAGMGTEWGDFDGDGRLDVVVTNLDLETNSLYRNAGEGFFDDVTFAAGIGEPSLLFVGFGVNWLDIDNDSDLDLFVANGHIIDNIEQFRDNIHYAQRNHLYLNDGNGQLQERGLEAGPGLQLEHVSRGSAVGDLDHDGDLDLLVGNNGQRADLLINDGPTGNWLQLRLVGRSANRSAVGARVRFRTADTAPWQIREIQAGSSYGSTSDPLVQLGLGRATRAQVQVRWPGGSWEMLGTLPHAHRVLVVQGRGAVVQRASAGSS